MSRASRHSRLSPGAQSLLNEYTEYFQAQLLEEAEKTNPADILNTRDLSDAYDRVQRRERGELSRTLYLAESGTRRTQMVMVYAVAATFIGLGSALLWVVPNVPWASEQRDLLAAAAAAIGGILAGAVVVVTRISERRSRSLAIEIAESQRHLAEISAMTAETFRSSVSNESLRIGRFIAQWGRVEERLRLLAVVAVGMDPERADRYPIREMLVLLKRSGVIDDDMVGNLQGVLAVRNKLAHGKDASEAEVQVGLDMMERLESFFDRFIDDHMVEGGL